MTNSDKGVLLTILGDRDPRPYWDEIGSEGPIIKYLDNVHDDAALAGVYPSHVHILFSNESAKKKSVQRANNMQELLRARGVNAELHLLETISDPTDYAALLHEMGKVVQHVRQQHGDENLTVLVSPGTPQMQAVWLILTNDGRLPARLFQRKEDDYGGCVVEITIDPLFESQIISSAVDMMRGYDFFASKRQLDILVERSYSLDRRYICDFTGQVCEMLHQWSLFEYGKALKTYDVFVKPKLEHLSEADHTEATQDLISQLLGCRKALGQLNSNTVQMIVQDLLWSAERFLSTGKYIDCVWRCRTLYELMLRKTLLSYKSSFADEGDTKSAEERLLGRTIRGVKISKGRIVDLPGLAQPFQGMTAIWQDQELYDDLLEINRIRNRAIHDGRTCSPEQTTSGFKATRNAVELFYNLAPNELETYVLSSASVQRLVKTAQAVLQRRV